MDRFQLYRAAQNLMAGSRDCAGRPHQAMSAARDLLREYQIPYRLGSRNPHPGETCSMRQLSRRRFARAVIVRTRWLRCEFHRCEPGRLRSQRSLRRCGCCRASGAQAIEDGAFVSTFATWAWRLCSPRRTRDCAVQGLKEIVQDGLSIEFMILEFAEAAKLYVPLTRLDLIRNTARPMPGRAGVNRLGSQQCQDEARVRKAMKDMAGELLKLYATRATAQGRPFPRTTNFKRNLKTHSITTKPTISYRDSGIKYDMESTTPWTAVVRRCGLWKNRSRMRAAFKAVQDGKQVAVLTRRRF